MFVLPLGCAAMLPPSVMFSPVLGPLAGPPEKVIVLAVRAVTVLVPDI